VRKKLKFEIVPSVFQTPNHMTLIAPSHTSNLTTDQIHHDDKGDVRDGRTMTKVFFFLVAEIINYEVSLSARRLPMSATTTTSTTDDDTEKTLAQPRYVYKLFLLSILLILNRST
jgi:hypothetical protein